MKGIIKTTCVRTVDETIVIRTCDICKSRTMDEDDRWGISATLEYNRYDGYTHGIIDVCCHCMEREIFPLIEKTFGIKARMEGEDE